MIGRIRNPVLRRAVIVMAFFPILLTALVLDVIREVIGSVRYTTEVAARAWSGRYLT